ncbi:MAG: hypothetical protein NTX76_01440 [Alphaproteobacteria bacterium]|nr:hypothetical protein [Alphaproteobacteria bacterium]
MWIITVPSKTFCIGEYSALLGGDSLVLTTGPRFVIQVKKQSNPTDIPFHPKSPAGKFCAHHPEFFEQDRFYWNDPHGTKGGFGSSTAEFIAAYLWKHKRSLPILDMHQVLGDYKKYAWDGRGISPSGADFVAQIQGGLVASHESMTQSHAWPFQDIDFIILKTPHKVPTHDHLADDSLAKRVATAYPDLASVAANALAAVHNGDAAEFVRSFTEYSHLLMKQDLSLLDVYDLAQEIRQHPGVVAAKGCGAMGADTMMILVETHQRNAVEKYLHQEKLTVVAAGGFGFKECGVVIEKE